jgi:hypothetical protein
LAFVGILACVSKEEFMDFALKIVECSMMLMRKKSQMSGKPVSQHVFIFDLDGFSLKVNNLMVIKIHFVCLTVSDTPPHAGYSTEGDSCL